MSVKSNRNGINKCNKIMKKVEPLISVDKLKRVYLFGIDIKDSKGRELPDEVYQQYIDNAVSTLEHDLDISVTPVYGEVDELDYRFNDYADWGFMYLRNFPVLSIQKLEMVYNRDANGNALSLQEIPLNWVRLSGHDGIIRLIPNASFPASLQVGNTGNFFPEMLRSSIVPSFWRVTYDHGFEDGKIPSIVNHAIGLLASIYALIVGGNLVLGAGIASQSLSIDGLSESISTTQSAENSSYSATIKEYGAALNGKTKDDPSAIMTILRRYFRGEDMGII